MSQPDEVFSTMPHPPKRYLSLRKKPTRFEMWAWSPVVSFQIGLTVGYLAMVYLGISVLFAPAPAFELTAPNGWSNSWAVALIAAGATSALGSVSRTKLFERIELVGSSIVSVAIGSYASVLIYLSFLANQPNKATAGAAFVALTLGFIIRTLWLFSQTLRK